MKRKIFAVSFIAVMLFTSSALAAIYAEGEALAVFCVPEGVSVSAAGVSVSDAVSEVDASVAETYETLSEIEGKIFVLVRSSSKTTEQLISELKSRPDVITASPNYYAHTQSVNASVIPNDPSADLCWGLEAVNAPAVWDIITGSNNIYVCVVDSGVYKHPDLTANIASEYGYNTQTVNGEYDLTFGSWDADFDGHGTHVAGIIGAVGNNGTGIAGVNWNVKIIPVRVLDVENSYETINYEIRGLNYIANLLTKNPDMKLASMNFSLGSCLPFTPEEMQNDVYYMAYQALDSLNRTLIVTAAGNSGVELGAAALFDDPDGDFKKGTYHYPAAFTGLNNFLSVGAMDSDDTAAYFTNWGDKADISAPGVSILSTYSPLSVTTEVYRSSSGTSMAAPHVTGAAALLMSAYPDATPAQIKSALLDGANKNKNPFVYPYEGFLRSQINRDTRNIDRKIASGEIPAESRDSEIARVTREAEEKYAPYKQLDGIGRVSRTGLLDVKAAYDILGERVHTSKPGSSSGGCNTGIPAVIVIALCVAYAVSKTGKI